jgi:nuclear transport factor 2 (NTF2) superfamily protein
MDRKWQKSVERQDLKKVWIFGNRVNPQYLEFLYLFHAATPHRQTGF